MFADLFVLPCVLVVLAFVLLLLVIVHVQLYHKLFALLLDEVAGGTRNLEEKVQDLSLPFDHYIYYYVL